LGRPGGTKEEYKKFTIYGEIKNKSITILNFKKTI
jgi:hypothetical protein